jgi:hypothetical protein
MKSLLNGAGQKSWGKSCLGFSYLETLVGFLWPKLRLSLRGIW